MAVKNEPDVLTAVESLAAHARTEIIPDVDVSRAVLRRLRNHRRPADRGLAILTASRPTRVIAMPTSSPTQQPTRNFG